jgi:tetrahydromethanopterin S-methyltransferase subunit F
MGPWLGLVLAALALGLVLALVAVGVKLLLEKRKR